MVPVILALGGLTCFPNRLGYLADFKLSRVPAELHPYLQKIEKHDLLWILCLD
jgi:hypothetical protein